MTNLSVEARIGSRHFVNLGLAMDTVVREMNAGWKKSVEPVSDSLHKYLTRVTETLAERHSEPWSPGARKDDALYKRSGRGMDRLVRSVKVSGRSYNRLTGAVRGSHILKIHEYGGTIRSKGKMLTVPFPAAMTKQGLTIPARKNLNNSFVYKTKGGNLIIMRHTGGKFIPLYLLMYSVKIKPRLGLRAELYEQTPYFLGMAADRVLKTIKAQIEGYGT